MEIPLVGFGTYLLQGQECVEAVRTALDVGYRHIDTAFIYENHREIAAALKGQKREELFITTKFSLNQLSEENVIHSVEVICDRALKELETDYIDLLLIHWPNRSFSLQEIFSAVHKLKDKGKIRYPGASNYTERHLQDCYDEGLAVPFNQVEFHPYLYQKKLLDFCCEHGTKLIAHRSFGKGELFNEPLFAEIGKAHGKTAGQVILRWIIQKKIPVIPKASSKQHILENIELFDFALTQEEEAQLDALHCDTRFCLGSKHEFDY